MLLRQPIAETSNHEAGSGRAQEKKNNHSALDVIYEFVCNQESAYGCGSGQQESYCPINQDPAEEAAREAADDQEGSAEPCG